MKNNTKKTHKMKNKKIGIKKVVRKTAKVSAKSKLEVKARVKIRAKVVSKVKTKAKKVLSPVAHVAPKQKAAGMTFLPRSKTILGPVNVRPYQPNKSEKYMNEKQLEHFRLILLQWKDQLMAEVDRTMHHMQEEVSNYPDPIDRASQEEEFSLELRVRDRERKLLRKIEEALNRISDLDYGYCDDCGAEIGVRRLEARPTATQCIECKTVSEIREKQIGESSVFD